MACRGRLVQIPGDLVEFFWPQAEPWLSQAEHRVGCASPAAFLKRLLNAECDLWLIYAGDDVAGAGITSVRNLTTVTVEALGGHGIDWRLLLANLEDLAREHGKAHVEIQGRPGWSRLFHEDGYRTTYVTLRKAL